MKKTYKLFFAMLIILIIISISASVMAATGSLYKKYKDGDFSGYNGDIAQLIEQLKQERDDLITQGLLGEEELRQYNALITQAQSVADNKSGDKAPTDEELKGYTPDQILEYFDKYPDAGALSDEVKNAWVNTLKNANYTDQTKKSKVYNILKDKFGVDPGTASAESGVSTGNGNPPSKGGGESTGTLGSSDASATHTLGEITSEAKGFLNKGTVAIPFNEGNLKGASDTLFNILLGLGMAAAVIIGVYLGVKFMISTVEDKAKVKEALIPYIAGCVVVFGAFTIWKLALLLLENIG